MDRKRTLEESEKSIEKSSDADVVDTHGAADAVDEAENKNEIKRLKKQRLQELRQEVSRLKLEATKIQHAELEADVSLNCVYISNVPDEAQPLELKQLFAKYGLVAQDHNGEDRMKLLENGEALLVYHNHDSVPLAVQMLDQTAFLPGSPRLMHVRPATPDEARLVTQRHILTPDQKLAMKQKMEKVQADLNSWDASSHPKPAINQKYNEIRQRIFQKVAVVENMFRILDMETDPALELDIKEDIREECHRLGIASDITKITIYANGAKVTVKFNRPELSVKCAEKFNERFYDGLKLRSYVYDGREL